MFGISVLQLYIMGVSFKTTVNIKQSEYDINHQSACAFLGSCFSDHIGNNLKRLKFPILQNPFGVLYNPQSIANALNAIIKKETIKESDLVFHNNMWHSFLFHGSFSNTSPDLVLQKTNNSIIESHDFLKNADFLFVTFGTAWVYEYNASKTIVSNCHKLPNKEFNRFKLSVYTIEEEWNSLLKSLNDFNSKLKVVFTVSPIRHLKDGAHENQLSKSTLFLAIDSIIQSNSAKQPEYFPSYEIVHDELRDYRFYTNDMVHIAEKAVQYIIEKFNECYFSKTTLQINENINKIVLASEHRILNQNREEIQHFSESMLKKIESLEKKHPFVKLSLEKKYFKNL